MYTKQNWLKSYVKTNQENASKPLLSTINRRNLLLLSKELKAEELIFDSSTQEVVKMKACSARDGSSNFIFKELFTG